MGTYIDLTHTTTHNMPVFPGEKAPSIIKDILPADVPYVTHRIESNFHTGTHMDAAWHVKADEKSMNMFPVSNFVAKAFVIDVRGVRKIQMSSEWKTIFDSHEAILFYTGHSQKWLSETYYNDYPEFDNSVAEALIKSGVRIAGFDSPSPDKAPFEFHSIFLCSGHFMIENMTNLDLLLNQTHVTLFAFPLKVEAEASLIRAVASIE